MFKKPFLFKIFGLLLIPAVGLGLLDPFSVVQAQDEVLRGLASLLAAFIDLILFMVLVALDITGPLFGTEFLTSDEFLNDAIRPMWVFVRNLVNLFFVGVIIFIALGNLYSSITGGGNWTIKDKLPRLIAAMVLINFSLLGMKIVLDGVYVGTVAMFGISDSALEGKTAEQLLFEDNLCGEEALKNGYFKTKPECIDILDPNGDHGGSPTFADVVNSLLCDGESDGNKADCPVGWLTAGKLKDVLEKDPKAPGRNVMAAVASQMMHIEVLPLVAGKDENGEYDIFRLINSTTFSFIMGLAYVISFIALCVGMLMRTVFLWVVMIGSPLIVADIILGLGWVPKKEMILHTIIMPIKVAAAFSVAFVMVANIYTLDLNEDVSGFFTLGISTAKFGADGMAILWQVATVVIFWMAIWAGFEKSIAEKATNKIKGFGEQMGKLAVKGASNIPIIPAGRNEDGSTANVGLNSLGQIDDLLEAHVKHISNENTKKLFAQWGPNNDAMDKSIKIQEDIRDGIRNVRNQVDAHDLLMDTVGGNLDNAHLANPSSGVMQEIDKLAKKIGREDFWTEEKQREFANALPRQRAEILVELTEGASGTASNRRGRTEERIEAFINGNASSTSGNNNTNTPPATSHDVDIDLSSVEDGGKIVVKDPSGAPVDVNITHFDDSAQEIHLDTTDPDREAAVKRELQSILEHANFSDTDPSNYDVEIDTANGRTTIRHNGGGGTP